jgi:hypothetical protein
MVKSVAAGLCVFAFTSLAFAAASQRSAEENPTGATARGANAMHLSAGMVRKQPTKKPVTAPKGQTPKCNGGPYCGVKWLGNV